MGEAAISPAMRTSAFRREALVSQDRSISGMFALRRRKRRVNTHEVGIDRRKRWTAAHAHVSRQFGLKHFNNALYAVGAIAAGAVKDLQGAKTIADVATQALGLENAAAETYTFATENVTDLGGVMVAATIQPVETMHAAILNFVLGQYPVPLSFIDTKGAVKPDALTK